MKTLSNIFEEKITKLDSQDVSEDSYLIEKLKKKLAGVNSIASHKPSNVLMPETVFNSSIEMKDIINLASSYIRLDDIKKDLSGNLLDTSNISQECTLYFASVIIRKAFEGVESIRYRPVNPHDIPLEKTENFIPDRLYTFINWILSPKQASTNETISKFDIKEHYPSLHRCTLVSSSRYAVKKSSRYVIYEEYERSNDTKELE